VEKQRVAGGSTRSQAVACSCTSNARAIQDRLVSPARISCSSEARCPGSDSTRERRPPPGRRTRVDSSIRCSGGSASSLSPAVIVVRHSPLARATAVTPPLPKSRASAAAHWRRRRSSISGSSARNLRRMRSTLEVSSTSPSSVRPAKRRTPIVQVIFVRALNAFHGNRHVLARSPSLAKEVGRAGLAPSRLRLETRDATRNR